MELFDTVPPAAMNGGRPPAHQDKAAILRANPYKWGIVTTAASAKTASSQATNIRTGKLRAFVPAGTFEAKARNRDVWARFIPAHATGEAA